MSLATLTVSVCLTMALLCGLMAVQFMLRSRIFLPKYTKMPTVCDLLDYATLATDDVIVLKSGCLMSMMELSIPDMSTYSDTKLASCYELCQKALLKLEGNYAIQLDAIRSEANDYAPSLSSKNTVLCDLEDRRKAKFSAEGSFDTRIYLTITYVGDSKQTRLLSGLLSKQFGNKNDKADTLNLIKDFRQRVKIVADSLRLCFPVELLGTEEVTLNESLKPLCAKNAAQAVAAATAATSNSSAAAAANAGLSQDAKAATTAAVVAAQGSARGEAVSADAMSQERKDKTLQEQAGAMDSSGSIDTAAPAATAGDGCATSASNEAAGAEVSAAEVAAAVMQGKNDSVGQVKLFDKAVAEGKYAASRRGKRNVSRLLSVIHECITGKPHMISAPGSRAYLDSLLATEDYISGYTPKMGSKFVCMLSIEGLPSATHEALLNTLATLPFAYRFNTRFVIFDHGKSKVFLMRYRSRWSQSQKGIFSQIFNVESTKVNQNAVDQVKDIDKAQRALDNNEVMFGSYTANVIIYDARINKLQEKAAAAIAAIEKTGMAVRVETLNSDDAFFGSLPGHITENLRRPLISQDVLLDLIPLSLPPRGERYSPNPLYGHNASPLMQVRTVGGSKYLLNLHEKDVGNTLVIGPTGAGKSMLLSELMVNLLRYKGMRVFAFDKGCSFHALTKSIGGKYVVLNNCERMLSPLYHLETEEDMDYAQSFIELLLRETNVECTPEFRYEIKQSLCSLASLPHQLRRLSDLHGLLCNQTLKQALAAYTAEQSDNCILDGNEDTAVSSSITTFECAEVFSRPESFSVPVLKHVFRLIERQLTGAPVAIVVDEAWLMLRDSLFADELLNWFKTLRKYNAFVILATQSLTDLQASEHFENILECAKTRIFLPNCDAVSEALKDAYTMMGLSDQEINLVAAAVPKRDYYFVKGEQRVLFNLMLSDEEKALLSIAGEHCVPSTNAMYNSFGPLFYTQLVDHGDDDDTILNAPAPATQAATAAGQGLPTAASATALEAASFRSSAASEAIGVAAASGAAASIAASSAAVAAGSAAHGFSQGGGFGGVASANEKLALKAAATILKDAAKASNTEPAAPALIVPLKTGEDAPDNAVYGRTNAPREYGREGYSNAYSDRRPTGNGWYSKGQSSSGEYSKGQYPRGEYNKGQYPKNPNGKGWYSKGQSPRSDYVKGQYSRYQSGSARPNGFDARPVDAQGPATFAKGSYSKNANALAAQPMAAATATPAVATAAAATTANPAAAAVVATQATAASPALATAATDAAVAAGTNAVPSVATTPANAAAVGVGGAANQTVIIYKPQKTFGSALMAGAKWFFGSNDNAKPSP